MRKLTIDASSKRACGYAYFEDARIICARNQLSLFGSKTGLGYQSQNIPTGNSGLTYIWNPVVSTHRVFRRGRRLTVEGDASRNCLR